MQLAEAEPAVRQSRAQQNISDSAIAKVSAALGPTGAAASGKSTLAQNYVVQRIAGLEDRLEQHSKATIGFVGRIARFRRRPDRALSARFVDDGPAGRIVANQVGIEEPERRRRPADVAEIRDVGSRRRDRRVREAIRRHRADLRPTRQFDDGGRAHPACDPHRVRPLSLNQWFWLSRRSLYRTCRVSLRRRYGGRFRHCRPGVFARARHRRRAARALWAHG